MLPETFERIIKLFKDNNGYLTAAQLKENKVTTIQIRDLVDDKVIEKISHGNYWLIDEETGKPDNYKMIEICRTNPKSVICADSACYYHGLTDNEPKKLSVATLKTDRSRMHMNFPVSRHYYSDLAFEQDLQVVDTPYGKFRIYDVERSVCDTIRFREDVGEEQVDVIVENYMKKDDKKLDRLYAYADAMRVGRIVRTKLEGGSESE